jgi:hypothetical protein
MSLRHSTRQEAAEPCQKLRRAVRDNVRGASDRVLSIRVPALDQACISAMALGGKLDDFPSPTIRSSENSEIYRLSCNLEARLTGKIEKRNARKIFTVRFTVNAVRLGR